MKANIKKNKNKLYIGIQILRIIFSFHILVFHCINKTKYKSKLIKSVLIDLKTFFIISSFFSYNTFTSRNILKIELRFKRLLIPYILWPIIFFIINNSNSINNIYLLSNIKYLYYQLLIGNGIHSVFWFQFNLIFVSIIFLITIFLIKKRYILYLFIIAILCFLFKITSFYKKMNVKFKNIAYFSIQPIPSSFISLFFGFYLSFIRVIDKINKNKYIAIILFLSIFCFYIYGNEIYNKYIYLSFFISDFSAISLFLLFMVFPFDKIRINIFYNIIKIISNYSGGIYYIHNKIILFLDSINIKIERRSMKICIINYIICYNICFLGHFIFKKSDLKYLFV